MYVWSLLFGILSFFIIFILHVIIWRTKKPPNEIMTILSLFIIAPTLFFLALLAFNYFHNFTNTNFIISVFLLYFALACAYVQTYPAAQANAPSLQIIYFIHKSGKKGLSEGEINQNFTNNNLVVERIDDLVKENFVYQENNKILLTKKGRIFINIFWFYRRLFGLEFGQG